MELEELKRSWKEQSARLDKLEIQNAELRRKLDSSRISGSKGKLMRIYRALMIVSLVMIPFTLISFHTLLMPFYVNIIMAAFFAQCAIVNFYVLMLIKEIDITRVSVKDALSMVINLMNVRHRLRIVEFVLMVPVLVLLVYTMLPETSMLIGGICGGVLGSIVGLKKEFEIRALLRGMRADLEDLLSEE